MRNQMRDRVKNNYFFTWLSIATAFKAPYEIEKLLTQQPSSGAPWVAMATILNTVANVTLMYSVVLSFAGIQQDWPLSRPFHAS